MVEGDGAPVVVLSKDLNEVGRRLGAIVSRLDLFFLNGELVFFDEGEQRVMTGRVFRTWINEYVLLASRYNKETGEAEGRVTLDQTDAATILECANFRRGVRRIREVNEVRLPVLRKVQDSNSKVQGTALQQDAAATRGEGTALRQDAAATHRLELLPWGYDEETQVFTVRGPRGVEFSEGMAVEAARGWLERLFAHFPFADGRSKAVMVGAMLALFVKHLPGGRGLRPGFLFLANKAGSGKSLLAKAMQYPVLGRAPSMKMKRGEELDKEMEAFQRSAVPVIFLDNIYGGIQSATLDQMLTSEESSGRAMGGHGTFTARNVALLIGTGNGLELNDDAARRFLVVDLFEKGDPGDRKVPREERLSGELMGQEWWRVRYLEVMWALVRHWVEAGRPKGGVLLGSFEEYSELLGGIVVAAGYEEPFQRAVIPDAISPERAEFGELLDLVVGVMVSEEVRERDFTLEELARLARSAGIFTDKVGTAEEGRRLVVKNEGLKKDEARFAVDEGLLTPAQRSAFGKKVAGLVGTEPRSKGGVRVEFGRRSQSRKATFTVKWLEG